jgi:hypothetical protein
MLKNEGGFLKPKGQFHAGSSVVERMEILVLGVELKLLHNFIGFLGYGVSSAHGANIMKLVEGINCWVFLMK